VYLGQDDQRHLFEVPGHLSQALEVALDDGNQQSPLNKRKHSDVLDTIKGLLSYYMQTGKRTCGFTYGAEKMHQHPAAKTQLAAAIRRQYHIRTGVELNHVYPDITDPRLIWNWTLVRKANHKQLRDGWAIGSKWGQQRLLTDAVDATVYAYAGNAGGKRGLIKIGYTEQKLESYLRSKELAHQPMLLATRPGSRSTEQKCLDECRSDKVVGNEWHAPTDRMCAYIRASFADLEPDFDRRFRHAVGEFYG
jgi:hypothetical protein